MMFSSWTQQMVAAQRSSVVPYISVPATPSPCSAVADAGERALPFAGEISAPNDGAHRLAWWLAEHEALGRYELFIAGASEGTLDRMVAGEVTPALELAVAIARATEGDVLPEDWDAAPGAAWNTPPAPRAEGE